VQPSCFRGTAALSPFFGSWSATFARSQPSPSSPFLSIVLRCETVRRPSGTPVSNEILDSVLSFNSSWRIRLSGIDGHRTVATSLISLSRSGTCVTGHVLGTLSYRVSVEAYRFDEPFSLPRCLSTLLSPFALSVWWEVYPPLSFSEWRNHDRDEVMNTQLQTLITLLLALCLLSPWDRLKGFSFSSSVTVMAVLSILRWVEACVEHAAQGGLCSDCEWRVFFLSDHFGAHLGVHSYIHNQKALYAAFRYDLFSDICSLLVGIGLGVPALLAGSDPTH
jgi:hypothetical protein